MLNYTLQYVKNYQGLNKWASLMSLPGHEDTGTVIETLDDDLVGFLKKLLDTEDEIVLFLMGDHGMRYGEWFKVLDGSHEHKLPALFIVASTSLLRSIPNSMDTLEHNSNRLVSKHDFHRTLKHLAHLPYSTDYTRHSVEYKSWTVEGTHAVSLLLEKIPNDRGCPDIGIPPYFCSCTVFRKVPNEYLSLPESVDERHKYAYDLLHLVTEHILNQINEEAHSSEKVDTFLCKRLSLNTIEEGYWLSVQPYRHLYKVIFTVNEDKNAVFEGVAIISSTYMTFRRKDEGYPNIPIYLNGKKLLEVMYIKRQDVYAGLCEEVCKIKQIYPPICICERLEYLKYREPGALEKLSAKYQFFLGQKGKSCTEVCRKENLACETIGINAMNTCKDTNRYAGCMVCYENESEVYPGVRQGVCYIGTSGKFDCEKKEAETKRVCGCA